ncbi:MAG: phage tail tube protein, partial [Methyloceanibacter sp.]
QPLGDDPLLGRGRNTLDPYRGLISDEGQIEIPFDLQGIGFWLTGLFGAATTGASGAAVGTITFAANPSAGHTITLNGVVWTFTDTTPSGNETEIAGTLAGTLDQLVIDLNGSANAEIAKCTYSHTPSGTLRVVFDTTGIGGNTFTLAASNATVSGATLSGGGAAHVWESGSDEIPSYTFEIGHPKLVTPIFFRHVGTVMESLSFDMGQEGPANGRIQLVAQGEDTATTTIDGAPTNYSLRRFSQGRGFIRRGGANLAGVTGGSLTFSNNLERVRVIREDGKIEAADPTFASAQGTMTVRFDGTTLVAEAMNGNPVSLEYGFTFADGYALRFQLPRVFLPKPKYAISGPGGVEASFDWRAAYDESEGTMLRAHLINDIASYG